MPNSNLFTYHRSPNLDHNYPIGPVKGFVLGNGSTRRAIKYDVSKQAWEHGEIIQNTDSFSDIALDYVAQHLARACRDPRPLDPRPEHLQTTHLNSYKEYVAAYMQNSAGGDKHAVASDASDEVFVMGGDTRVESKEAGFNERPQDEFSGMMTFEEWSAKKIIQNQDFSVFTDFDGVGELDFVELQSINRSNGMRAKGLNETEEAYQAAVEKYEARMRKYNAFQKAKREFFSEHAQHSRANLIAMQLGAYELDEDKISRLLNALFLADGPGRVFLFLDDKHRDILPAMMLFMSKYPHIFQGKLAAYHLNKYTQALHRFRLVKDANNPQLAGASIEPEDENCLSNHNQYLEQLGKRSDFKFEFLNTENMTDPVSIKESFIKKHQLSGSWLLHLIERMCSDMANIQQQSTVPADITILNGTATRDVFTPAEKCVLTTALGQVLVQIEIFSKSYPGSNGANLLNGHVKVNKHVEVLDSVLDNMQSDDLPNKAEEEIILSNLPWHAATIAAATSQIVLPKEYMHPAYALDLFQMFILSTRDDSFEQSAWEEKVKLLASKHKAPFSCIHFLGHQNGFNNFQNRTSIETRDPILFPLNLPQFQKALQVLVLNNATDLSSISTIITDTNITDEEAAKLFANAASHAQGFVPLVPWYIEEGVDNSFKPHVRTVSVGSRQGSSFDIVELPISVTPYYKMGANGFGLNPLQIRNQMRNAHKDYTMTGRFDAAARQLGMSREQLFGKDMMPSHRWSLSQVAHSLFDEYRNFISSPRWPVFFNKLANSLGLLEEKDLAGNLLSESQAIEYAAQYWVIMLFRMQNGHDLVGMTLGEWYKPQILTKLLHLFEKHLALKPQYRFLQTSYEHLMYHPEEIYITSHHDLLEDWQGALKAKPNCVTQCADKVKSRSEAVADDQYEGDLETVTDVVTVMTAPIVSLSAYGLRETSMPLDIAVTVMPFVDMANDLVSCDRVFVKPMGLQSFLRQWLEALKVKSDELNDDESKERVLNHLMEYYLKAFAFLAVIPFAHERHPSGLQYNPIKRVKTIFVEMVFDGVFTNEILAHFKEVLDRYTTSPYDMRRQSLVNDLSHGIKEVMLTHDFEDYITSRIDPSPVAQLSMWQLLATMHEKGGAPFEVSPSYKERVIDAPSITTQAVQGGWLDFQNERRSMSCFTQLCHDHPGLAAAIQPYTTQVDVDLLMQLTSVAQKSIKINLPNGRVLEISHGQAWELTSTGKVVPQDMQNFRIDYTDVRLRAKAMQQLVHATLYKGKNNFAKSLLVMIALDNMPNLYNRDTRDTQQIFEENRVDGSRWQISIFPAKDNRTPAMVATMNDCLNYGLLSKVEFVQFFNKLSNYASWLNDNALETSLVRSFVSDLIALSNQIPAVHQLMAEVSLSRRHDPAICDKNNWLQLAHIGGIRERVHSAHAAASGDQVYLGLGSHVEIVFPSLFFACILASRLEVVKLGGGFLPNVTNVTWDEVWNMTCGEESDSPVSPYEYGLTASDVKALSVLTGIELIDAITRIIAAKGPAWMRNTKRGWHPLLLTLSNLSLWGQIGLALYATACWGDSIPIFAINASYANILGRVGFTLLFYRERVNALLTPMVAKIFDSILSPIYRLIAHCHLRSPSWLRNSVPNDLMREIMRLDGEDRRQQLQSLVTALNKYTLSAAQIGQFEAAFERFADNLRAILHPSGNLKSISSHLLNESWVKDSKISALNSYNALMAALKQSHIKRGRQAERANACQRIMRQILGIISNGTIVSAGTICFLYPFADGFYAIGRVLYDPFGLKQDDPEGLDFEAVGNAISVILSVGAVPLLILILVSHMVGKHYTLPKVMQALFSLAYSAAAGFFVVAVMDFVLPLYEYLNPTNSSTANVSEITESPAAGNSSTGDDPLMDFLTAVVVNNVPISAGIVGFAMFLILVVIATAECTRQRISAGRHSSNNDWCPTPAKITRGGNNVHSSATTYGSFHTSSSHAPLLPAAHKASREGPGEEAAAPVPRIFEKK